mgnify:CR=1 FL=1
MILDPSIASGVSHPSPHHILARTVSSPHLTGVRLLARQANLQRVLGALHPILSRDLG